MRTVFITLIFLLRLFVTAQNAQNSNQVHLRPEIEKLVKGIAKDNVLKSSGVGVAGTRTEQWERYESLCQNATTKELLELTDYSNADAKYSLLRTLQPNIKYYSRVREIATKENSPVATLALSRFKNPADIGTIKLLFKNEKTEYYAAYCAREFPDGTFYPLLVKIFEREWLCKYYDLPKWRILYQALSKYPTEQTYQLFKRTIDCKDGFRHQTLGTYLMIAITKYPDKLFDPLKSKIKLNKYHQRDGIICHQPY
ncbi:MAG: hypothetical protein WCK09_13865 [Bacteroidota bacterium]